MQNYTFKLKTNTMPTFSRQNTARWKRKSRKNIVLRTFWTRKHKKRKKPCLFISLFVYLT